MLSTTSPLTPIADVLGDLIYAARTRSGNGRQSSTLNVSNVAKIRGPEILVLFGPSKFRGASRRSPLSRPA